MQPGRLKEMLQTYKPLTAIIAVTIVLSALGKLILDIPMALRILQVLALVFSTEAVWAYAKAKHGRGDNNNWLRDSTLIATLAYLNFLWFFMRIGINASGLGAAGIVYARGTSLTVLTIVLCLNVRLLQQSIKRPLSTGKILFKKHSLKAVALSVLGMWILIYVPIVQSLFQLSPLSLADWSSATFMATVFVVITETARHMSRHSRKAVHAIHPELKD